jgi:putative IMPACT (imprinted ancient) family translation regulator
MMKKDLMMNFGDFKETSEEFILLEKIIEDKGSKYSVSCGFVQNREDAKNFLKKLKLNKKYRKASHNSFAIRISKDLAIFETKNDDGETGAGNVILNILRKRNFSNIIVVVTR